MQRRVARKSSNGGSKISSSPSPSSSYRSGSSRGGGGESSKSSPFVGLLIIFGGGALLVILFQLVSSTTSSGVRGGKKMSVSMGEINGIEDEAAGDIEVEPPANAVVPNAAAVQITQNFPNTPLHSVGTTSPASNATLHIIFSTDCSAYQHWQSYLFFHQALKVQQPGYVTRIASGCNDNEMEKERQWHMDHIQNKMTDRFRIHFTPHFSGVKDENGNVKGDYKFFNKPFGLKHFLENFELLGFDASGAGMKNPDDIIILTDPDFLLLRPITDDFSNKRETLIGGRRKAIYDGKKSHIVTHGNPYAQTYGLGTQWRKFDLDDIAGADSPAKLVEQREGGLYYPVGPPYIATAKDMYNIANVWSEFAPRVHKQYPHLLAEMYAYCIAAAHLKLPHMLIDSMMVSAAGVGGEGWKFVKDIPAKEVCSFASNPNHNVYPVPSVIHYCQRYHVDKYFWGKRKMPKDIFTCDHPLLVEPPMDLGSGNYLSFIANSRTMEKKEMSAEKEKMDAFAVCALTKASNDAMITFKNEACEGGGNMKKVYSMWAGKSIEAE